MKRALLCGVHVTRAASASPTTLSLEVRPVVVTAKVKFVPAPATVLHVISVCLVVTLHDSAVNGTVFSQL